MAGTPYPKPSGRRRTIGATSRAQVDAVRERVFDRDERTCLAVHHGPCLGGLTIQHAIGRGMGGSAQLDRPSLLRTLCAGHNERIEESALFRSIAESAGWSLSRFVHGLDPSTVPVRYPGSRWFLLDDEFDRVEVWP